ncbi:MAG: hypothetical protein ACOYMA_20170 [Bacteroidia bacterium]
MTISALKKELYKTIDAIEDNAILEAVYTILKSKSVTKKVLVPMSKLEFLKRNEASQKNIEEGNLVTHAALKKQFAKSK